MAQATKFGKQNKKANNKQVFLFRQRKDGKPNKHFAAFWTVEDAEKAQKRYDFETFIINELGKII